ncbi:exo-beta-N-acetylmuramidase NamZ family protein [Jeotgalibacillus soli]|uniref:DUF1343 domain-containing protein n=1 Tax=Jeotgalibacillus soli TaxID=889306 RepID=A0A0C2S6B0_9BACL|nr:DUF1343 domain-containing protein [Jeotgalibacillus soli]KIL49549.1 hypothetical protein KP78_10170 [Jeotgalibacillus soli]
MSAAVKLGIEMFLSTCADQYAGKRVGLITNQTGTNSRLITTIQLLHEDPRINLTVLFAPEHGITAVAKEGEKLSNSIHRETGLPVYSLYGDTKKPKDEMMSTFDVILFDLQDIGARYYTYIYTMAYMMQACAKHDKEIIVLDRPNPIGGEVVEGNLVEENFRSFVGLYPIPNRHGMTVGELAKYFNEEFNIHCTLTVVKMEGWRRQMSVMDTGLPWIPPSPNTTNYHMMLLYTGTCLIEGMNVSEGRGTTQPFEIVGAPFIDGGQLQQTFNAIGLPGVKARAISFKPTYQKYKDETCQGIQLHVTSPSELESWKTGVYLVKTIYDLYLDHIVFLRSDLSRHPMFDLISGSDKLRNAILQGEISPYLDRVEKASKEFKEKRKSYLLYST